MNDSADQTAPSLASQMLRRSYLGAGTAGVMALVLALAAVLGTLDAQVAAEGCIALAALVLVFYVLLKKGIAGAGATQASPSRRYPSSHSVWLHR